MIKGPFKPVLTDVFRYDVPLAEPYLTPMFRGERVALAIDDEDFAKATHGPGLKGIITDLHDRKRYALYGTPCEASPNCHCGGEIVPAEEAQVYEFELEQTDEGLWYCGGYMIDGEVSCEGGVPSPWEALAACILDRQDAIRRVTERAAFLERAERGELCCPSCKAARPRLSDTLRDGSWSLLCDACRGPLDD